jgi:phosphoglycerate dehydrogenase-like enzyme
MSSKPPVLVVEDDVWARLLAVVLDPATSQERRAAYADFMSPDEPAFETWCERVRQTAGPLYPSDVRLVSSDVELRTNLAEACAVVTESLVIGSEELKSAHHLKLVYKYGTVLRNVDVAACESAGVKVCGVRRRANIACAEHAFALMLALAKRLNRLQGVISVAQLPHSQRPYRPFDRRHTPGANWARFREIRMLNAATLGIIGLGEIGREIALRGNAFGMRVTYFQRSRLSPSEEAALNVSYQPLDLLLAQSDWVIPQLPGSASTVNFIDAARLARMKGGACLVNVARAELVERGALLDALRSGRLGGFALDPQYQEPGESDDELLSFDNVVLTPHIAGSPRLNGLADIEEVITGLAEELASKDEFQT